MAGMSPGQSRLDTPISAGNAFKVNVSLAGPDGLVSFYANGGAGVLQVPKAPMKGAIYLWKSK